MARRAYVGLSSPLAYDYKNSGHPIHPGDVSAPNPILEDSLGLLIFYDEIVFLSRHLCPQNMRDLEYVSFLNERPDFAAKFPKIIEKVNLSKELHPFGYKDFRKMLDRFGDAISAVTGQHKGPMSRDEAKFLTDNHTHGFALADGVIVRASPTDFHLMCIDWETISAFELEDCDPIFNSANSGYYGRLVRTEDSNDAIPTSVAHKLIVRHLPNYLSPAGPYHECLEELRRHQFLEDLRSYLDEILEEGRNNEIDQIAEETERLALEYREKIFSKYLSGSTEYFTIGKAAVTEAVGLIIPGTGLAAELVSAALRKRERNRMRWAGFVVNIGSIINTSRKS